MKAKSNKWYTIKVTPIDEIREPYEFLIETSNINSAMEKYTTDKEGEIISLWEVVK